MSTTRKRTLRRKGGVYVPVVPVVVPPTNVVAPSIVTTPVEGSPVTFAIGSWVGTEPITVHWRWVLNGVYVAGADDTTYTLPSDSGGGSLQLERNLTGPTGLTESLRSAAVTILDVVVVPPPDTGGVGADPDAGLTHDPADAVVWDSGTSYTRHTMVKVGSTVYQCLGRQEATTLRLLDVPAGTAVTNTTYFRQVPAWYYIDSAIGNDNYTGTSKTVDGPVGVAGTVGPWQSPLRVTVAGTVTASAAAPGTVFVFKRGLSYDGCLLFNIASSPIGAHAQFTCGSYGVGARPYIRFLEHTAAPKGYIGWTNRNGGLYFLEMAFDGLMCMKAVCSGGVGGMVAGETITGQTTGRTATLRQVYGTTLIIQLPGVNGFANEVVTTPGGKTATITGRTYITGLGLEVAGAEAIGCEVYNTSANGLKIGGGEAKPGSGNGVIVKHCHVEGCAKITDNGAGIDGGDGAALLEDNTLIENGHGTRAHNFYVHRMFGMRVRRNYSQGSEASGLVLHGTSVDFEITDNDFTENGIGIDVSGAYGTAASPNPETFTKGYIARNKIRLGGNPLLYFSSMVDSIVECNLIYGNILNTALAYVAQRDLTDGDSPTNNLTFRHNTLVNFAKVVNINGAQITNLNFYNNVFVTTSATSEVLSKLNALSPTAQIDMDYNQYYMSAQASTSPFAWDSSTRRDLAYMRTTHGKETNGDYGDPLFTNMAGNDYTLQVGSPCKNSGKPLAEMLDINGAVLASLYDIAGNAYNAATPSRGCYA
jgi:hypothetical protein